MRQFYVAEPLFQFQVHPSGRIHEIVYLQVIVAEVVLADFCFPDDAALVFSDFGIDAVQQTLSRLFAPGFGDDIDLYFHLVLVPMADDYLPIVVVQIQDIIIVDAVRIVEVLFAHELVRFSHRTDGAY